MQTAFDVDIKYREHAASPAVIGTSPNWLQLRSDEVLDGVFFTENQNAALARVAVIGTDVRTALFPDEDPLGKTLRIADVPFQVIGLLKSRGAGPAGGSLDNLVLIPVNTASRRLFNRDFLTMVIAQVKDPDRSSEATEKVMELLRERHHIRPPALDDFTITNPAATMAQVTRAGSTLTKILTGVAAMALLIGGIHVECSLHLGHGPDFGQVSCDRIGIFESQCGRNCRCGRGLGWNAVRHANAKIATDPGLASVRGGDSALHDCRGGVRNLPCVEGVETRSNAGTAVIK